MDSRSCKHYDLLMMDGDVPVKRNKGKVTKLITFDSKEFLALITNTKKNYSHSHLVLS